MWLRCGLNTLKLKPGRLRVQKGTDHSIKLSFENVWASPTSGLTFLHRHSYRVLPTAEIVVANRVVAEKDCPTLPRIGVTWVLSSTLEDLRWFGRGPWENYADRNHGAPVGHHAGTVASQYVPYMLPQENGHKTDVRWLALADKQRGLLIEGMPRLEFSASHFTDDDLFAARHTVDLAAREEIYLNIDHRHRGLGSEICGPDTEPRYRIPPGTYSFSYRVRPYHVGQPLTARSV